MANKQNTTNTEQKINGTLAEQLLNTTIVTGNPESTPQPELEVEQKQEKSEAPAPMSAAMRSLIKRAAELAATTSGAKGKVSRPCECGCGLMTKGGHWFPGHDSKFQSAALRLIREGKEATPATIKAELRNAEKATATV